MIKDKEENIAIHNMKENNSEDNYIHCLSTFTHAFYKELGLIQKVKTEMISKILTLSDEAFMLLCIRVYYGNDTDLFLEEDDEMKRYVIKLDWQEASILVYNNVYHRVVADGAKNNN